MLKKLLLIVLCSSNLYATEPFKNLTISKPNVTLYVTTGDLVGTLLMTAIIPNMIKSYLDVDDTKDSRKDVFCKYFLIGIEAALVMYYIVKLCVTAKRIYDYSFPTEAEKALRKAAAEMNKIFDAQSDLRNCLMRNARNPRNDAGLPTMCENLVNTYRTVAGQPALDEMTINFKNAYGG